MQRSLYLYLFVFSALIALYLGISGSNSLDKAEARATAMEQELTALKDSLQAARLEVLDMQYFSLANNDDALAYYDELEMEDPSAYISDKLLETNELKGNNPLVPYEGMENDFKINKIKILNHKWILADFSDGKYWGELLIGYEIKADRSVDFTLLQHLLYTRSF